MKKFISYLWPFTKKIPSEINGILEVSWINGKKVLDTKNANYSYGSLQKILTFGLSKISIHPKSNILLLGLGAGCIINPIREEFNCSGKITAVELDKVIIAIAEQEFNVINNKSLEIVCADALEFVTKSIETYHLIIIDLFIDNQVPKQFYSIPFWSNLIKLMAPEGFFIFNAGINTKDKSTLKPLINFLEKSFDLQMLEKVNKTNILIIGKLK